MSTFETIVHERVALARAGENPTVICKMPSGWAVLGDEQHLRGYSFLLPDPVVSSLNDLTAPDRQAFLRDMGLLGDALLDVCNAERINYEILGNTDPALHAHVVPRYANEAPEKKCFPPFVYHELADKRRFDAQQDSQLMLEIRIAITRLLGRL